MPPANAQVNDVDLSTFNMWCNMPEGWHDAPHVDDTVARIYGMTGGILEPIQANIAPRTVTVEGVLIETSAVNARAKWDAAKQLICGPEVELTFTLSPDRKAVCRYQAMDWIQIPTHNKGFGFRLTFLIPGVYLVGKQVDVYSLSPVPNTRVPLQLGTAPSFVDWEITGTGNPLPAIMYYDAQGQLRGLVSYNFGGTFPTAEWVEFNGRTHVQIFHRINDTLKLNASGYMVDNAFFVADPADGDGEVGPTMQAINCNGRAYVRKAWR